jgi:hypothetical protein
MHDDFASECQINAQALIEHVPVVPHKAVAEVSKIGNL